jgi:hypothetical protein
MTILTPAYIRLLKESAGYYCLFTKITGLPLKFLQSSVCLKGCCGLPSINIGQRGLRRFPFTRCFGDFYLIVNLQFCPSSFFIIVKSIRVMFVF